MTTTTTPLSSEELNYLVFRYLQESGLTHSAFALGYEAGINRIPIDGNLVPPGALITFVQKGLLYLEMEANLTNNDADADDDFAFLQPLDLITKDVYELRQLVKDRKESLQKEKEKDKEKEKEKEKEKDKEKEKEKDKEKDKELERDHEQERKRGRERDERDKGQERDNERMEKDRERKKEKEGEKHLKEQVDTELVRDQDDKVNANHENTRVTGGPEPMDICATTSSLPIEIPSTEVTILEGHTHEVFACAWSPSGSLLASGSGDSTARIWAIPEGPCGSVRHNEPPNVLVLKHYKSKTNEESKDVTTLDWNGEGTLLATGSYDGQARIWSRDGELKTTLNKHKGPIFCLKWNKKGDYLLSGSVDRAAIVWDVKTGEAKQKFEFHSAPTLDVDWRNNAMFATSSTDTMIYVCKIGENRPVKNFSGHQGEVNAIKWDPTGSLLASCSDDGTAKVWSMKQDKYIYDLKEHTREIYTIRWCPIGQGAVNPNQQLVLASASFDSTVKLWDAQLGTRLHSLNGHREPVYSIAFSPSGEYLASGSVDKNLHIWSVKEGKIVKTYTGNGSIFEVCWNKGGDKIAACFGDSTVCVVDFRM